MKLHVTKEHNREDIFISYMLIQIKILNSKGEQARTKEIVLDILILDPFEKQSNVTVCPLR